MNLPLISRRLATRAMVDTVLLACCSLTMAANHPVSVTETAAFVTRDKVSVRISVFVEDLFL